MIQTGANTVKMNIRRQSTLRAPAVTASIALHNGQHTRLVMRPAPIGNGLRFVRTDITDRDNVVPVRPDLVTGVRNCTTLSNAAGVDVSTIEHLMAALSAAGIDNLDIELDGSELPALDGSSEPFLQLIEQVGVHKQSAPRRYVKVIETVEVRSGDMWARIDPCDRLELDVTIDFAEEAIGNQRLEIVPDVRSFRERMAGARTFARLHEVAALQAAGLSKGGSYDNAVVVDDDKVLNPDGLRFDDEFVRHKALDLLGDLYLGGPILGRVITFKSGHGLNHDLLLKLYGTPSAWMFTSIPLTELEMSEQPVLTSVSA